MTKFITLAEATRQTGLSKYLLKKILERNEIGTIKTDRKVLINAEHLERVLEQKQRKKKKA